MGVFQGEGEKIREESWMAYVWWKDRKVVVRDQSVLIQLYNLASISNTGYSSPGEIFLFACSPPKKKGREEEWKKEAVLNSNQLF